MRPVLSPRITSPSSGAVSTGRLTRSMAELQMAAKKFSQYSLTKLADRKRRQLGLSNLNAADVFQASEIMSGRDAETVYMCLPFATTPPRMQLVYSSRTVEPNVYGVLQTTQHTHGPTVLLARVRTNNCCPTFGP